MCAITECARRLGGRMLMERDSPTEHLPCHMPDVRHLIRRCGVSCYELSRLACVTRAISESCLRRTLGDMGCIGHACRMRTPCVGLWFDGEVSPCLSDELDMLNDSLYVVCRTPCDFGLSPNCHFRVTKRGAARPLILPSQLTSSHVALPCYASSAAQPCVDCFAPQNTLVGGS